MRASLTAPLIAALLVAPATADTSYLRPNLFTTATADLVTVQSSFTEDFANPGVAVRSDKWAVIRPDGRADTFDRVEVFNQLTVLETDIAETGTYRLSTGERLGRSGPQVLVDGVWTPWGPERPIPEGAQTRASQTATLADVYITKGAPTQAPLDAQLGRLELKPLVHPADMHIGADFRVRIQLDGKPVANQPIEIWREGGAYDDPPYRRTLTTPGNGEVTIRFERPGVYLIWTRMSAASPPGAETPVRSYTSSLTLDVPS